MTYPLHAVHVMHLTGCMRVTLFRGESAVNPDKTSNACP